MSPSVQEQGVCRLLALGGFCKLGEKGGSVVQATHTDVTSDTKRIVVEKSKFICIFARNPKSQATCSTARIQ